MDPRNRILHQLDMPCQRPKGSGHYRLSEDRGLTHFAPLDEVAARQFVADRACYALRDALVCRVGQGMERGAQPHVIIDE
jgi:hypothetical protein